MYILIIVRICFLNQITQLKIASNPFAKGFRDCDPDDWYVLKNNWFFPAFLPSGEGRETLPKHDVTFVLRSWSVI